MREAVDHEEVGFLPRRAEFDRRFGDRTQRGSDGRPKSWYIDADDAALDGEIAFLRTEIYLREIEPRLQTLTAFTRCSGRIWTGTGDFGDAKLIRKFGEVPNDLSAL